MTDVRHQLEEAGTRLAKANADRKAAMAAVADLVRQADDEQVPVSEIARLGHISRPTVYKILGREQQ